MEELAPPGPCPGSSAATPPASVDDLPLPPSVREWVREVCDHDHVTPLVSKATKRAPCGDDPGGLFVTMESRFFRGRRVGVIIGLPNDASGRASPLAEAGLQHGDAIIALNTLLVDSTPLLDVAQAVRDSPEGDFLLIFLRLPYDLAESEFELGGLMHSPSGQLSLTQYRANQIAQQSKWEAARLQRKKDAAEKARAEQRRRKRQEQEQRQEARRRKQREREQQIRKELDMQRAARRVAAGASGSISVKARALARVKAVLLECDHTRDARRVYCTACTGEIDELRWFETHPMLSVTICSGCLFHYNYGTFEVGEDGNEDFCRWCGDGGDILMCDTCVKSFCRACIRNNFGEEELERILHMPDSAEWRCPACVPTMLQELQKAHVRARAELIKRHSSAAQRRALAAAEAEAAQCGSQEYVDEDGRRVHRDIARGREGFPIRAINDVDDEDFPLNFQYVTDCVEGASVRLNGNPSFRVCCDCDDNCRDRTKCACARLNGEVVRGNSASKGHWPYNRSRRLLGPQVIVYECHSGCRCHPAMCANRAVGLGVTQPLEIFKTKGKGWGVRSRELVPAGSFVCTYAGELLSEEAAEQRANDDEYLFNIDAWANDLGQRRLEQLGMKEGYEENVVWPEDWDQDDWNQRLMQESKDHTNASRGRGRGTGRAGGTNTGKIDILVEAAGSQSTTANSSKTGASATQAAKQKDRNMTSKEAIMDQAEREAEKNGQMLCIDAKRYGNIGRFLNTSCEPNCIKQAVFTESQDVRRPHMAIFAIDDIPAMTELTYDYNYQEGQVEGKTFRCACGAPSCRGRLY